MKNCHAFVFQLLICFSAKASGKDSTVNYSLPDSVKVVQFMAEIKVGDFNKTKWCRTGIKTNVVSLYIDNYYKSPAIRFRANENEKWENEVYGVNTNWDLKYGHMQFQYDWKVNETYKLMIAQAGDSAGNFSLYSGYIFLPVENKWKLIGTIRIKDRWHTIQQPAFFCDNGKKNNSSITTGQVWCQRQNGSWKNMKEETQAAPIVNLFGHVDSIQQREIDIKLITDKIVAGNSNEKVLSDGIYYTMMKEGTGRQVSLNDTVTVFYKGYLFANDSVFDQTKDKPATFPLKRLIKGWQTGLSLCKVGGKIKLTIPSDLGYSIRTRAAKIPPNSILVFEIEVIHVKSPQ